MLCRYVYRVEGDLFFQGEFIDCMPRDIALSCSAGDGRAGRCLLVLRLDSRGHSSPLACAWGMLRHERKRAIERASSELRYPFEGSGRWCSHRWHRINRHGLRDNAGGVVACDALMQPLGCFQNSFRLWIPSQHDRMRICYARYSENGCFIDHPLFCLTFLGPTFCFHPLFLHHRGGLRRFLTRSARSLSEQRPFIVLLACAVCSVSLLVKAQKCWCGIKEGN